MNLNEALQLKNISPVSFLALSAKKWYIYTTITVISIIICFIYSFLIATPMYTSTAEVYILKKDTANIEYNDFTISTYLTYDFVEIISDNSILEIVSDRIDNKYSASEIKSYLKLDNPDNTRIIKVSVESPNAKDSKLIVDTICKVSQEKLVDIMELDRVKIIGYGDVAVKPSSPNILINFLISFAAGLLIAAIIIITSHMFNDRFTSSKEIEQVLGVSIIGTIPYNRTRKQ